jgi:peptide deformylase
MATKDDIIAIPDPRLRQKSKRVSRVDAAVKKLAHDMIAATLDWEASRAHESGAALAAVQIGRLARLVVIRNDFDNKDDQSFSVYINPEIVETEGEPEEELEGCLSVQDLYGAVPRYPKIKAKALNLNGKEVMVRAQGFLARVFQHEIDHTNGLVYLDRITDPKKIYRIEPDGSFSHVKLP